MGRKVSIVGIQNSPTKYDLEKKSAACIDRSFSASLIPLQYQLFFS